VLLAILARIVNELCVGVFFDAARMSEGLVVASCGLYLPMVAKSPESHTTVVPVALSWSREEDMVLVLEV